MDVKGTALLVIDLENGFIDENSPHQIRFAKDSLYRVSKVIEAARIRKMPIFFIKRIYRQNGADVELSRYASWKEGGRAMTPGSFGENSAMVPEEVKPKPGDYTIIKPRWSAFFQTELDLILRRLGIRTVFLTGTTTPNCIRTTAYDANSLDYNVVVIEDCCSSQTEEIQKANIYDMENMGAVIINSLTFCEEWEEFQLFDPIDGIRQDIVREEVEPEPIMESEEGTGWFDRW